MSKVPPLMGAGGRAAVTTAVGGEEPNDPSGFVVGPDGIAPFTGSLGGEKTSGPPEGPGDDEVCI
jgi:hypothetical protein